MLTLLSFIDLTSLNSTDTIDTIKTLCSKAVTTHGSVAAVCVYPQFVTHAADFLKNTPVKIATVANFPSGNEPIETVLDTIQQAIKNGAQEIDVVFPYQKYLKGEKQFAIDFIRQCKKSCVIPSYACDLPVSRRSFGVKSTPLDDKPVLLKVILETGAFPDKKSLASACEDVIKAGADFLKTSTGKIAIGATLESAEVLLNAIQKSGKPIGLKVSGGIKTIEQATQYLTLTQQIMGQNWASLTTFRLGASQLIDLIIK